MQPFYETQISRNRENRQSFVCDPTHRDGVTRLILKSAEAVQQSPPDDRSPDRSLMVLGAGNGFDLDLPQLARIFCDIHLVDIDREAVERCVSDAEQSGSVAQGVCQVHAPIDIAAPLFAETPADPSATPPGQGETIPRPLLELLTAIGTADIPPSLPECDVVVSACLLSQLVETLSAVVPPGTPQYAMAIQALRIGHFKRMLALCKPAGTILLITDLVSSETVPELRTLRPEELKDCIRTSLQNRNFFTGCNPELVLRDLQILSHATGRIARITMHEPWLWNPGPRVYAVFAVQATL